MRTFMTILAVPSVPSHYRKENHKLSFDLIKSSTAVKYAYMTVLANLFLSVS